MKFLLLIPLLLLTLVAPAKAQPKKFRSTTKLDRELKKNVVYQGEHRFIELNISRYGFDPNIALYEPEFYAETSHTNSRQRFVQSYYTLKEHAAREPKNRAGRKVDNSILFQQGMGELRKMLIADVQSNHQLNKQEATQQVETVFDVLDIKGATEITNGMSFYSEFTSTFQDRPWINFALELEYRLDDLLSNGIETDLTLYDIAHDITHDHRTAIKLLGLVMARDIQMIDYFDYMENPPTQDDIERMTRIPKLVRAYTDWLQWRNGTEIDAFSFPGKIESNALKNHYFWSEAYLMQQLLDRGLDTSIATTLCKRLLTDYQKYRQTVTNNLQRARWDVWMGLTFSTVASAGYYILDQIFSDGNASLSPYVAIGGGAIGVGIGERIVRKLGKNENAVNRQLGFTAVEFATEVWQIQGCEDTWLPKADGPLNVNR